MRFDNAPRQTPCIVQSVPVAQSHVYAREDVVMVELPLSVKADRHEPERLFGPRHLSVVKVNVAPAGSRTCP